MLVLSRKLGESIRIGEDIVVTITEIRGGRVKIGISAPEQCGIRRGELQDWNEQPAPTPISANLAAANSRRSSGRADEKRAASVRPAATTRVRLAMETTAETQFVIH